MTTDDGKYSLPSSFVYDGLAALTEWVATLGPGRCYFMYQMELAGFVDLPIEWRLTFMILLRAQRDRVKP